VRKRKEGKGSVVTLGIACFAGAAMLAWPLFGNPPSEYLGPMKWIIAGIFGFVALEVWQISRAFLPLSILFVISGLIGVFGDMSRSEWKPFHWASLGLLTIAGLVCLISAAKARTPAATPGRQPTDTCLGPENEVWHTPDPVNLSGDWDPSVTAARLIYTASPEEDLQEYELRGCFGDSYTTEEEEVLDNNPPGTLEFVNSVGLVAPGSRAFYKVYVKLNTGNERGSNTVSVVRE
jgi:hypothetical protein